MTIAIASGKGGTGKTTVATSLLAVARPGATYVDCDVEAPNGHLFLRPRIRARHPCPVTVPRVDPEKCTLCGRCREVCRFHAIAVLPRSVLVFDELCHGCGGCALACPAGAIREELRPIGVVEVGSALGAGFVHGRLNVGEAMSPPLIRAVREAGGQAEIVLLDAPPGTSCPAVASVRGADYCVLVTEPTPFGLHDLGMAVGMVRALGIPFGVVINRSTVGDGATRDYCRAEGIEILEEIPSDRRIAEAYVAGEVVARAVPGLAGRFEALLGRVLERAAGNRAPS